MRLRRPASPGLVKAGCECSELKILPELQPERQLMATKEADYANRYHGAGLLNVMHLTERSPGEKQGGTAGTRPVPDLGWDILILLEVVCLNQFRQNSM